MTGTMLLAAGARGLLFGRRSERDPVAYRLLVDSLFSSPTSFAISNGVGILIPVFCLLTTGSEFFRDLAAAVAVLAILRTILMVRYRRLRPALLRVEDVRRWDLAFSLSATLFSALLGLGALYALAWTNTVQAHIMTIGGTLTFGAGYVARNAGRPRFVIVQLACFCLPTLLGLFLADEPDYEKIGAFIAMFFVANVSIVFSLNRNLLELAAATKQAKHLADSLRTKNVTLDSALNCMTHGLCMFDADLNLEIANARFVELFGLAESDVVPGAALSAIAGAIVRAQTLTPQSARDMSDLCGRAVGHTLPAEREMLSESGQVLVIRVDTTPDGGVLMLTEDATARKTAALQIERMAHSDTLTGLPNRFRFGEVLKAALSNKPSRQLSLLYVDLDNFKIVNDTMGHEAGDKLLISVSDRLRACVETFGLVARFGGDEFLILADATDDEGAMAIGRRVVASLIEPIDVDGKPISITASVGVAIGPRDGADSGSLLRAADLALYAAKAEGRNVARMYSPVLAEALSHRREMELDLREAARAGLLALHYQPIVDARTEVVRCYEALMRWPHPTKGMISPAEFIPIAEQTGLITTLGAWALRQACLDAVGWSDRISVAVNVSAFQFRKPSSLVEAVKDALLISGLSPHRLELEVTESLLIADQEETLGAIRQLRRLGVRFALDDFGSGYSSLGYLARYPFSKVKIDRSFAEQLTTDSPSRSIIEVVCQLAAKLGMHVVVEGIETEAQRREIVMLGAEQAQGWLFGRAEPIGSIKSDRRSAA